MIKRLGTFHISKTEGQSWFSKVFDSRLMERTQNNYIFTHLLKSEVLAAFRKPREEDEEDLNGFGRDEENLC